MIFDKQTKKFFQKIRVGFDSTKTKIDIITKVGLLYSKEDLKEVEIHLNSFGEFGDKKEPIRAYLVLKK